MNGIKVMGYTADYSTLNLELKKDDKIYDMALLVIHIEELKKGMKVVKINKTTSKGTRVKYEAIETKEEAYEYYDKIKAMIEDYNAKYDKDYTL